MGIHFRSGFGLLALALFSLSVHAKVLGLFDIDGTIFNDKGADAAWRTPWLLKRIDQMHSMFQQAPNKKIEVELNEPEQIEYYNQKHGTSLPTDRPVRVQITQPEQIAISYDEFYKYQEFWAKSEDVAGSLKPVLLSFDPLMPARERLILPGYFREFDLTFKYYRESTGASRKSYLVQDYLQAKDRARLLGSDYTWKGRAFALWQAFMAKPETVMNAQRFTARGHRLEEYYALDKKMVEQGDLKAARGPGGEYPIVHSLSQPDSRIYGASMVERKVGVVRGAAEALYRSSGAKHRELHPDAHLADEGVTVEVHTEIVAEDEVSYVSAISDEMLNLSGSYSADKIKLVLFNTGSDEDVAKAKFPYRWTVFYGRRARAAKPEEIAAWLGATNCEFAIKGGK